MYGYFETRGTYEDDFTAKAAAGSTCAWVFTQPGIEHYVADKIRAAAAAGLHSLLNIERYCFSPAITLRPTVLEDWSVLDQVLREQQLWRWVTGFYVIDEPFWRGPSDKILLARTLRVINQELAHRYPGRRRLTVHAWLELLEGHPAELPELVTPDGYGFTDIGFCHYSERDGQHYCDTPESYRAWFDKLRARYPNTLKLLVPDAAVFEQDELDLPGKLARFEWIAAIASEPDVTGVFPYCWWSEVNHTGLQQNPQLLTRCVSLAQHLTGRVP